MNRNGPAIGTCTKSQSISWIRTSLRGRSHPAAQRVRIRPDGPPDGAVRPGACRRTRFRLERFSAAPRAVTPPHAATDAPTNPIDLARNLVDRAILPITVLGLLAGLALT